MPLPSNRALYVPKKFICPSTVTSAVWPRCTATGVVCVIIGYEVCAWAGERKHQEAEESKQTERKKGESSKRQADGGFMGYPRGLGFSAAQRVIWKTPVG